MATSMDSPRKTPRRTPRSSPQKRALRPRKSFNPDIQSQKLDGAFHDDTFDSRRPPAWQREARTKVAPDGSRKTVYQRFNLAPSGPQNSIRPPKSPGRPSKKSRITVTKEIPVQYATRSPRLVHKTPLNTASQRIAAVAEGHQRSSKVSGGDRSSGEEAPLLGAGERFEDEESTIILGSDVTDHSKELSGEDTPIATQQHEGAEASTEDSQRGSRHDSHAMTSSAESAPLDVTEILPAPADIHTAPGDEQSIHGLLQSAPHAILDEVTALVADYSTQEQPTESQQLHNTPQSIALAPLDDTTAESAQDQRESSPPRGAPPRSISTSTPVDNLTPFAQAEYEDEASYVCTQPGETQSHDETAFAGEAASRPAAEPVGGSEGVPDLESNPDVELEAATEEEVLAPTEAAELEPDMDFELDLSTALSRPSSSSSTSAARRLDVEDTENISELGDNTAAIDPTTISSPLHSRRSKGMQSPSRHTMPIRGAPDSPQITTELTTTQILLNDDTTLLHDFLERARASKVARLKRRESESNKRDSDVVKLALASPRKVLENMDTNSPVAAQKAVESDTVRPTRSSPPPPPRDPAGDDETTIVLDDQTADDLALSTPNIASRRNTRRSANAQSADGPPTIELRTEYKPTVAKRTEAQELANLTRANTRRNRGGAIPARATVVKLKGMSPEEPMVERDAVPGRRNVTFNDQRMIQLFRGDDEATDELAAKGEEEPALGKSKAKRVKALGAINGTPARKREGGILAMPDAGNAEDANVPQTGKDEDGSATASAAEKKQQQQRKLPVPKSRSKADQENEGVARAGQQSDGKGVVGRGPAVRRSLVPRSSVRIKR